MATNKHSALAQAARILGEKGGKKGGPARARALTHAERVAIARKGGKALQRIKGRKKE